MIKAHKSLRDREEQELHLRTVKRIIEHSSLEQGTKLQLQRLIRLGPKFNTPKFRASFNQGVGRESSHEVNQCLSELARLERESTQFCEVLLRLLRLLIVSPVESAYILSIEKELKAGLALNEQIDDIQENMAQHHQSVLLKYKLEKEGKAVAFDRTSDLALSRTLDLSENRVDHARHKLNRLQAENLQRMTRIGEMRKERTLLEEIRKKLTRQLEERQSQLSNQVERSGSALDKRLSSENQLQRLKECAEEDRKGFRTECTLLNIKIKEDQKFIDFLKTKQKNKELLHSLSSELESLQARIEEQLRTNSKLDEEYRQSSQKEEEVKRCYETVVRELDIPRSELGVSHQAEQIIDLFTSLNEKNANLGTFVADAQEEIQRLQQKVEDRREVKLQTYFSGEGQASKEKQREDGLEDQQRKESIREQQELTTSTVSFIRSIFERLFKTLSVPEEKALELRGTSMSRDCVQEYMGVVESRVLASVSFFARVVAEQLRKEKNDSQQFQDHVNDLGNIIVYENNQTISALYSSNFKPNAAPIEEAYRELKQEFEQLKTDIQKFEAGKDSLKEKEVKPDAKAETTKEVRDLVSRYSVNEKEVIRVDEMQVRFDKNEKEAREVVLRVDNEEEFRNFAIEKLRKTNEITLNKQPIQKMKKMQVRKKETRA